MSTPEPHSTRSRESIEDALRGYVSDLELDYCVDRVLAAIAPPATPDRVALEQAKDDAELYGKGFVMIVRHEDGTHHYERVRPERIQLVTEGGDDD